MSVETKIVWSRIWFLVGFILLLSYAVLVYSAVKRPGTGTILRAIVSGAGYIGAFLLAHEQRYLARLAEKERRLAEALAARQGTPINPDGPKVA
ncbi:MAG TPA: hypothetical protein VJG67_00965 [Candidatus Paceibacterota bacterium]